MNQFSTSSQQRRRLSNALARRSRHAYTQSIVPTMAALCFLPTLLLIVLPSSLPTPCTTKGRNQTTARRHHERPEQRVFSLRRLRCLPVLRFQPGDDGFRLESQEQVRGGQDVHRRRRGTNRSVPFAGVRQARRPKASAPRWAPRTRGRSALGGRGSAASAEPPRQQRRDAGSREVRVRALDSRAGVLLGRQPV